MKPFLRNWIKPSLVLIILAIGVKVLPIEAIDPWGIFSPRKLAKIILALAAIQAIGSLSVPYLGARIGARFTGFFGGLVSSTAVTALAARKSRHTGDSVLPLVTILSATVGMLVEIIAISWVGLSDFSFSLLAILLIPLAATEVLIFFLLRKKWEEDFKSNQQEFEVLPIIKLSLVIIAILTLSKVSQSIFGSNGLLLLTFLVSFFEIHGSVVANIQLYETGAYSAQFLATLLTVSIMASYLSKLGLVLVMGSSKLKKQLTFYILILSALTVLGAGIHGWLWL